MSVKRTTVTDVAYNRMIAAGFTKCGVFGAMGNIYAESGFLANNLENLCEKRLAENGKIYTDETYTQAVDNGEISREEFLHPLPGKQYGYGLCQWTSPGRKGGLYDLADSRNVSIADPEMQVDFMIQELQASYKSVLQVLKTATSVKEASDAFLVKFEAPANTGDSVKNARASYGEQYKNLYSEQEVTADMSKVENAVARAEAIALDDFHGYDQVDRWGNPNYDCSGLVIDCLEDSGIPVKSNGASYTGNMKSVFLKTGFSDVISQVSVSSGSGLVRGDVLLGNGHTAFYCGNGKIVHASINEKGTITGGQSGDQTGREICIRSYYNKPWTSVLRYTGESGSSGSTSGSVRSYLMKGDSGDAVKEMQKMLIAVGFSCGSYGIDGSFGGDTDTALRAFQSFYGLEVDGKYGPASKAKLESVYNNKVSAQAPTTGYQPSYKVGTVYTLQVELKVRTGAGTGYPAKSHSQLTADGQKHDKDNDGCLDAGTQVTCQQVKQDGSDVWIKAPSGWMAAYYSGKVYIK